MWPPSMLSNTVISITLNIDISYIKDSVLCKRQIWSSLHLPMVNSASYKSRHVSIEVTLTISDVLQI